MRFSYNILFLGLWLTGQCWVPGETYYPKPSISVRPSETVAVGETVNIYCKNEDRETFKGIKMEFHLVNDMSKTVRKEVTKHDEVVLSIVNVTPSDAGIYRCIYCYKNDNHQGWPYWSYYSDSVNISIREQVHKKVSSSENAGEKNYNDGNSTTIIWAGATAGCLVLVLLLLLLAFILYRRRKKGSTTHERTQPLPMKETSLSLEPVEEEEAEDDPDEVSYAVLSHYSMKRKEHAKPDNIPESCVYASLYPMA